MRHLLSILFGAGFTIAACWSCGKLLLARLKIELFAGELEVFRFVTGAAIFSFVVFLITACHWARESVLLIAGATPMAAAFRVKNAARVSLPNSPVVWRVIFLAIVAVFGTYYFVNALAPESSPDGSSYHLGLVAKYLREHRFGHITTSMYASMPEGLEMLFLPAFAFGRHSAAALVEFSFLTVLPFAIVYYGRRFGFELAGIAAAAMVFCSPVFGMSGTTAYNDAAAALAAFCLFYVLQIWDGTRQSGLLVIAGLLAGFGYAIKYTMFLASIYAAAFVLWKLWRAREKTLRPMTMLCASAAILILPWWIKNWITVANPFSPFANALFPNPFVTIESERYLSAAMRSALPLADRATASMVRGVTGGLLGPLFLLTPLGLLAARAREGRQLIVAGFIFLLPAFTNSETRFLMPAAPFWALSLAVALTPIREALLALTLAAAILGWPSVVSAYCEPWAWRLNAFPLAEALRRIPEEVTLSRRTHAYDVMRVVEKLAPKNARIFSFGSPMQAYLARDVVVSFQSALGDRLSDSLWLPTNVGLPPTVRRTLPFFERPLRKLRVVQTGGPSEEQWSISEIRIYDQGREVPRAPNWKLRASPNPWDVQLAFDNNPATRWRSAQRIYPGMFIEIDLGQAQTMDSVVLECADDQSTVHMKLEAETAPGVWSQLSGAATDSKFDSGWNLRKAAIQSLKAAGITHLLIDEGDFIAKDLRRNYGAWGIRLISRTWTNYLYELQ